MKKPTPERHWLEEARKFLRYAEAAMLRAQAHRAASGSKLRRPKKPPRDEGGAPMPAVPRPKPKPLAGGAAAPIEREFRLRKSRSGRSRAKADPADVSKAGPAQVP